MPGQSPGPGHFAGGRFIRNLGPSDASRDARLMYVSGESWLLVIFVELIFGLIFGYVYCHRAGMVEKYLRRRA